MDQHFQNQYIYKPTYVCIYKDTVYMIDNDMDIDIILIYICDIICTYLHMNL